MSHYISKTRFKLLPWAWLGLGSGFLICLRDLNLIYHFVLEVIRLCCLSSSVSYMSKISLHTLDIVDVVADCHQCRK